MVAILYLFRRVRHSSLVPEKFLTFNPSELQTHTHARIQAFLLAQASCCFLYKAPLSEDEWLLSLCSCLSSSGGLVSPGSFDP